MNEDFLQYIWRFQRFSNQNLLTTDGQPIQVIKVGVHNKNAGPDFLDARIRIGQTVWAGNVEVHLQASDWYRHKHQDDPAYDNVVLHVVYTADVDVKNGNGYTIPMLSLKDMFDFQSWRYFNSWLKADSFIPCEKMVPEVPDIIKSATIQSAAVQRMHEKSALCLDHLQRTQGDAEESLYRVVLRSFGAKVNAIPFEQLALVCPYSLVRKVRHELADLEALLLGQAGFLHLEDIGHPYLMEMQNRYSYLRHKFGLKPMPHSAWKLFRLRPANFPQVRIAQVAKLYHLHGALAQTLLEIKELDKVSKIFSIGLAGSFWHTHYTLEKESPPSPKRLGTTAITLLIVNAVVPFLFALGKYGKDQDITQRAFDFLEQLPPEKNEVTRRFAELGFGLQSALDSQGAVQLKKFACDQKKCLSCKTGIHLLERYAKNT